MTTSAEPLRCAPTIKSVFGSDFLRWGSTPTLAEAAHKYAHKILSGVIINDIR